MDSQPIGVNTPRLKKSGGKRPSVVRALASSLRSVEMAFRVTEQSTFSPGNSLLREFQGWPHARQFYSNLSFWRLSPQLRGEIVVKEEIWGFFLSMLFSILSLLLSKDPSTACHLLHVQNKETCMKWLNIEHKGYFQQPC